MIQRIFAVAEDLLFPPRCLLCDRLLSPGGFEAEPGFCEKCAGRTLFTAQEKRLCRRCCRPISRGLECEECATRGHSYKRNISLGLYAGEWSRAIKRYKFAKRIEYCRVFARLLAERIEKEKLSFSLIVCVPLTEKRERGRGYNQCALLAAPLSKRWGIPFDEGALRKTRETMTQSLLPRYKRRANVKGAFAAAKPGAVAGKSVLLIDDVYTSGATLDEIAKVLKREGAKSVTTATLAITIR
jgi:ComF family protein